MALKFKTKDEIPAEHLPLYAERDGPWLLDVDGAVEKTKLDEFRTTNVSPLKERDELKKRFEGIDPDEVRKLADEKRRLEEGAQLKAGEVEKVVEARVKALKGDFDKQLSAVTTERDALNARVVRLARRESNAPLGGAKNFPFSRESNLVSFGRRHRGFRVKQGRI